MIVEDAWSRLVRWCELNAPVTLSQFRAPAEAPVRAAAEAAFPRRWPDDLRTWYARQDGAEPFSAGTPLPDWRPLSVVEMRDVAEMFANDFFDAADIDETESEPAGTFASTFAPSFVPIADNGASCFLFVDCRVGERSGCVMEWDRDELAMREPQWGSVGEMLEDAASCVETGRICGTWRPTVVDGELVWEFDSSVIDSDPWQRARDLYGDFREEMNRRGDPYFRSPVTAGGRDWSNFEIDVMENVISNALHNRVPVQDWPAEQLTHIQRDFTALRAALPLFEAPDREYFALMERVWEATLAASRPSAM